MAAAGHRGLTGLSVVALESRRAAEPRELIRRHRGDASVAPAMREAPLADAAATLHLLAELERGAVEVVTCLTGVGVRALAEAVAQRCPRPVLAALLGPTVLVARGPKSAAARRELGLHPQITMAEPQTRREILCPLDTGPPLTGQRVAVQEYGTPNRMLFDGLAQRGATVLQVPT